VDEERLEGRRLLIHSHLASDIADAGILEGYNAKRTSEGTAGARYSPQQLASACDLPQKDWIRDASPANSVHRQARQRYAIPDLTRCE
jgi:hypothetical protein